MKKCFKCGEVKDFSFFYKHKQMADGHLNKCKDCAKKDARKTRGDNLEYYREYDRKRGNRQSADYVRKYRSENPMKYAAHSIVNHRIRDGLMVKAENCESCGCSGLLHGHHDDYSKPLDVRWLCPACHRAWHSENGEGLNAV